MLPNLFLADQIIFWMAVQFICIYHFQNYVGTLLSYIRLLLDKSAEWTTLKWWSGFTKPALLNPSTFYRQKVPTKLNPGPKGRNFILTSLFSGLTFCPLFSNVFPRSFSPVDPSRDHCLWLVTERRVMRFYGQQRGRLCTETAAGAAVTVAVLLLAPHCSQDEVHRCSHSVQWFIGCLKQCISVKNNSS